MGFRIFVTMGYFVIDLRNVIGLEKCIDIFLVIEDFYVRFICIVFGIYWIGFYCLWINDVVKGIFSEI